MLNRGDLYRRHRVRGFSVLEGLIVTALLAILSATALPSWSAWVERKRVRAAAEAIHNGIQLARVEAITRNARTRLALQADGSWTVQCTAASTASGCDATAVLHAHAGGEGRGRYTMSVNGATLSGTRSIDFTAFGRPDGSQANRITRVDIEAPSAVDSTSAQRAMRIEVTSVGRVRLCEPYAESGSVTRC